MISAVGPRRTRMSRPATGALVLLLRDGVEVASWPLAQDGVCRLEVVDHLARLQLAARRVGYAIGVRDAGIDLWLLLDLVGLAGVLTGVSGLGIEMGGEAEDGEQVGVEEAVDGGDTVA